jgi:hypothetical protein
MPKWFTDGATITKENGTKRYSPRQIIDGSHTMQSCWTYHKMDLDADAITDKMEFPAI